MLINKYDLSVWMLKGYRILIGLQKNVPSLLNDSSKTCNKNL